MVKAKAAERAARARVMAKARAKEKAKVRVHWSLLAAYHVTVPAPNYSMRTLENK